MASSRLPSKRRQYLDNYIKYGFTEITKDGVPCPQCVICFKVLTNESLKPSMLTRHLSGCHQGAKDKDIAFFKRKEVCTF